MVRAFIAVEISPEVRKRVEESLEPLRRRFPDLKWVQSENLHLTLRFLGEIEESQAKDLEALMTERFKNLGPVALQLRTVGKFPDHGTAVRVVWIGVEGDVQGLKSLWERAQACAREIGLEKDDHGFSPHITVARTRASNQRISGLGPAEFGTTTVDRVILFQSELSPKGPAYTPLFEVPLI